MADKSRLKDSNEIFSSIDRAPKQPLSFAEAPAQPAQPIINSKLDSLPALVPAPQERPEPAKGHSANEDDDKSPLDFQKYRLPARSGAERRPGKAPRKKASPSARKAEPELLAEAPPRREEHKRELLVEDYRFEDLSGPAPSATQDARPEPGQLSPALLPAEPEPVAAPLAGTTGPAPREQFLQRLSRQFDEQFIQRFEHKPEQPWPLEANHPRPEPSTSPPSRAARPEPDDLAAEQETERFLSSFRQEVELEEELRTEQFKETLAQKFERERQRYLKELEVQPPPAEPDPEPVFAPPAHRRLDLRIQPEMHRPDEDPAPLTYTRTGQVRPLDPLPKAKPDDQPGAGGVQSAPPPGQDAGKTGKKSAEELLMELAKQGVRPGTARPKPPVDAPAVPQKLIFVDAGGKPVAKKKPRFALFLGKKRRIIAVSSLAAVLVLALLAWPLAGLLRPDGAAAGDDETGYAGETGGAQLTVYESREFTERGEYNDVYVRRANISLKNLSVKDYLMIDEVAGSGAVHLENVTIGGVLYLRGSGVNALSLHNVSAERIVVNNPETKVELEITGAGSIGTVEIKTPAAISRTPQLGAAGEGVRDVLLRAAQDVEVLHVSLSGVELATLASYGESIVELLKGSYVERMTAEGSLSLSGEGSVLTLSVGPGGAEEALALQLRGVNIAHLNLKGTATVNVSTQVDSMAAADHMTLTGNGRIATLVLDSRLDGARLLIDLSELSVQALISNAQSRLRAAGNARINELTANHSVYALGNKVNHLIVNADQVIYENEPDKITVASGVAPPESVADNPNLDYSLSTALNTLPTEAEDDGVSSVCAHSRDSGGFLAGDGSRSNPFQVATPAQLAHVSAHPDSHFIQTADIDLSDDTSFVAGFAMIASEGTPFSGVYDGGGHAISNLRIASSAENVGLFAESIGTVRGVRITSGEIRGNSTSRTFVGGVVGLNYQDGLVESCSNAARVIGTGSASVGGIAGYNYGGRVRNSYNTAKISGESAVGGIVGANRGGAAVSSCYNVGAVEADYDMGGVVGVNADGVVTNCYYLADTAQAGVGSGGGTVAAKTSEELSGSQMVADLAAGADDSPWIGGSPYPALDAGSAAGLEE